MTMSRYVTTSVVPLLCTLVTVAALSAQTPAELTVRDAEAIPPEIADAALELYNRPETIRVTGEAHIAAGTELVGDLAVLGGPLTLEGQVRGRVVVLNGSARLAPGATITGDLIVLGGEVDGLEDATVTGSVDSYTETLRIQTERGRLVKAAPAAEPEISAGRDFVFGRTDLTLATRRGYNRVEGLPIVVGPRFETRGANPFRLETLLIYRSGTGLDPELDDLGYTLRLEQDLGGRRAASVGATLHSEIAPIERWGISDTENSLATFLLRRDYRDYFQRDGWSAYLKLAPRGRAYETRLEYRSERHESVPVISPWTPFGSREWRPQPRIAEGTLHSLAARAVYDSRNEGIDPTAGWYIQAEVETGLGGTVEWSMPTPAVLPCSDCDFVIQSADARFAAAHADVRRYARLSPDSRLTVRALVSSSLDDRPLPPQRQRVLGGEGSLPGYSPLQFDCRARNALRDAEGLLPYYGCDRLALVQLEYQMAFPFARGWGRRLGWDVDFGDVPGWVIFFDAGRAWTERTARMGRSSGLDDFAADVGMGLRFGKAGLYWAMPLSGRARGVNFFVRLGPRL